MAASQPFARWLWQTWPGQRKWGGCPARGWASQPRARKGQAQWVTTDNTSARARLQIDISQNLDTKSAKMPQKWGTDLYMYCTVGFINRVKQDPPHTAVLYELVPATRLGIPC